MQEKRRNKGNYHNISCFLYAEVYSKTCGHRQGHAHFVPAILPVHSLLSWPPDAMTGTVEQWKGFFKLRCDVAAHPQARELAIPLKEEFIKRNLINN